jgi:outer membrane protein assembly factor BamB
LAFHVGFPGRRHHYPPRLADAQGFPVPFPRRCSTGIYLYLVNDMTGIATCYAAKTGKLIWQGRLTETGRESFSASPVGVDDKVFFTSDNGETFVLKAGPEFKLLSVNRLNEQTLASPALAGLRDCMGQL